MKKVQRARVGQVVQADVSGTGEWLAGEVTQVTKTHITFAPDDGSEPVEMARSEVFKGRDKAETPIPPAKDPEPITDLTEAVEADDVEFDEDPDEVRLNPDHEKYESHPDTPTESGRASYDTGDKTADELRGMALEEVYRYAYRVLDACDVKHVGRGKRRLEIEPGALEGRYGGLNKGMQRMNLGNLIRGAKAAAGAE